MAQIYHTWTWIALSPHKIYRTRFIIGPVGEFSYKALPLEICIFFGGNPQSSPTSVLTFGGFLKVQLKWNCIAQHSHSGQLWCQYAPSTTGRNQWQIQYHLKLHRSRIRILDISSTSSDHKKRQNWPIQAVCVTVFHKNRGNSKKSYW